jgi:hypothetical protein
MCGMLGGVQPKRGRTGWGRDRCGALRGKNVSVGIKQNRTRPGIGTMGSARALFCIGFDCCFAGATPGTDPVLLGSGVSAGGTVGFVLVIRSTAHSNPVERSNGVME